MRHAEQVGFRTVFSSSTRRWFAGPRGASARWRGSLRVVAVARSLQRGSLAVPPAAPIVQARAGATHAEPTHHLL